MPRVAPQPISSPRLDAHRNAQRKAQRRIRILIAVLFGVVVVVLGWFIQSRFMRITQVMVTGTQVLTPEMITDTVHQYTDSKKFFILERGNIVFRGAHVENVLHATYPRIKTVNVRRTSFHTLSVSVVEYTQSYLWCGQTPTTSVACMYVDQDGTLFSEAPEISGVVYVKLFTPISNASIGQPVLPADRFRVVQTYINEFTTAGLAPYALSCDADRECVMYLSSVFDVTHQAIKINTRRDPHETLDTLVAALRTEPLQTKWNTQRSAFSYIDLRFENKVYYKWND